LPLLFDTATGARDDHADHHEVRDHVRRARDGKDSLSHGKILFFRNPVRNFPRTWNDPISIKKLFLKSKTRHYERMAQDFAGRLVAAVVENY